MIVHIPSLLAGEVLTDLQERARRLAFEPGSKTAGWHARLVKSNMQAVGSSALRHVQDTIVNALGTHSVFSAMVLPRRIAPPIVSLSGVGEGYGTHIDDAIMGRASLLRTDVSITVFLSDPADYDGGELVVETLAGEETAKFAAGDAAVYPSTTLHRVDPVTRGERLVAATWAESRVRDAACREALFDLERARRQVFEKQGKCEAFDLISKTYANLLRRWADV
ncbi:MAG: Fe2+-dependent dioxygenase [Hyphomicrobiaceae bacterium]|nr:Fe2+-dependent dioxygenase [Hyphomicrobiaceae bacterium]